MNFNQTPNSNRTNITILGRCNSGKSSLLNFITSQQSAVVSHIAGTTTDTVKRAMELIPLGATLFIDTPGFDDQSELGIQRIERTRDALDRTDLALLLFDVADNIEKEWFTELKRRNIPTVAIISKCDIRKNIIELTHFAKELTGDEPLKISTKIDSDLNRLQQAIVQCAASIPQEPTLTEGLISAGETALLVMPQDPQAPKGRLILPQVQTIRDLLDKGAIIVSSTTEQLPSALSAMQTPPSLIITDSQAFDQVYKLSPKQSRLTSFSILMARQKGDINIFIEGAEAIDRLTPNSKVLIAEACTHAPLAEDIGREKLPRMLRKRIGEGLHFDIVSGHGKAPLEWKEYDLILHCGGCMFNRRLVMSRIHKAQQAGVPITNYGIALAHLTGILAKVTI